MTSNEVGPQVVGEDAEYFMDTAGDPVEVLGGPVEVLGGPVEVLGGPVEVLISFPCSLFIYFLY